LDEPEQMRRRTKAIIAMVPVAFVLFFLFVPVETYAPICEGSPNACIHMESLSCPIIGFGGYTDFTGRYFVNQCGLYLVSSAK
jgi:hypothetical protein